MTTPTFENLPILVETSWLAAHLRDPQLKLFDVTSGETAKTESDSTPVPALESFKAGHLPGAHYLDIKTDFSDLSAPYPFTVQSQEDFAKALRKAGVNRDSFIVLYSTNTYGWATRLWWQLRHAGFTRAAVLNGSRKKWVAESREIETGDSGKAAEGDVVLGQSKSLFADKKDVQKAIATDASCVIDSLSPKQYSGEVEGKNGRRGHIAGAVNVPSTGLIDPATNTFKSKDAIETAFRNQGVLDKNEIITYCGGGIAATVDAFALTLIGKQGVKVYDASLTEWTADPDLPMEVSEAIASKV